MKIKLLQISFKGEIDYQEHYSEQLNFQVEVDDKDDLREVVKSLRQRAYDCMGEPYREALEKRNKLQREVKKLEIDLEIARSMWDKTKAFLVAQGIKPNASDMPSFTNYLLPSKPVEEAEFDDDDKPF